MGLSLSLASLLGVSMFSGQEGTQFKRNRGFHFPAHKKMEFVSLKSLSMMLPGSETRFKL